MSQRLGAELSTLPCARGSALLLPLRSTVHVRCLTTSSQWKSPEPKNRPRHTCVPWINTTKQQQMTVSKRGLIKRLAQKTQPTGKEARLKLNVPTLGSVIDPYQPVSNMLAPTQLWEALRNVLKNITSKFRIQKHDASFSMYVQHAAAGGCGAARQRWCLKNRGWDDRKEKNVSGMANAWAWKISC